MSKITLSKSEAARRQIDAAIRLTLGEEDPVAIMAVAAGGHRIIRDLIEREQHESFLRFTDWIKEGHEAEFWRYFNATANFLKHAAEDPMALREFDELEADFLIAFACRWYADLGFERTREMRVFMAWFQLCHPDLFNADAASGEIRRKMEGATKEFLEGSRQERRRIGRLILDWVTTIGI